MIAPLEPASSGEESRREPPAVDDRPPGSEAAALLAAIQFLTRLPTPPALAERLGARPENWRRDLQRGAAYFPLVGLFVGAIAAGALEAAAAVWSLPVAILLGLIAEALLTGALHEDALADCCDGFGGGWSREDVLRIMKDSRVGSYGTLGLVLAVSLRLALLAALAAESRWAVVIGAAVLGRAAMTALMLTVPPPDGSTGLGRLAAATLDGRTLLIVSLSTLLGVAPFCWLAPWAAAAATFAAFVTAGLFGLYARRRIGGATGDVLGAACVLAQLAALLAATARFSG